MGERRGYDGDEGLGHARPGRPWYIIKAMAQEYNSPRGEGYTKGRKEAEMERGRKEKFLRVRRLSRRKEGGGGVGSGDVSEDTGSCWGGSTSRRGKEGASHL